MAVSRRALVRSILVILLIVFAGLGLRQWASPYARAVTLVAHGADLDGWPRRVGDWLTVPVGDETLRIPTRTEAIRAIHYRPERARGRPVVVVTGVHPEGIDDPRLARLSRAIAGAGLPVITPELPDLIRYEITPRVTDLIEDIAAWIAQQAELAPEGRVGLIGISFSGGLSVVAAGRQALADRLAFVLSFGGHGDLPRALDHLAAGFVDAGNHRIPNEYGAAIILLNVAQRVVPPGQVREFREAVRSLLDAMNLAPIDWARAQEEFARARRLHAELPEPAATLFAQLQTGDTGRLRPLILPHLMEFAAHPALSPERSAPPPMPVYLLHGGGDDVIPPSESMRLAAHLEPTTPVQLLVTPMLAHTGLVRDPGPREVWRLVSFWARLLGT